MAPARIETTPDAATAALEALLLRDELFFPLAAPAGDDFLEQLAPIVKESLRTNGLALLIHTLNDIVSAKDDELSQVLLASTRDINSCIASIDDIQGDLTRLNHHLLQISSHLTKLVHELLAKKKVLIRSKEVLARIEETSNVLNLCLLVLEITNKTHELIKQKRYFSALKLIDELTQIHLPKVGHFSFAAKIYALVPTLTRMIQDEAFDNLGKWLALNLERKLLAVGERLFEQTHQTQQAWEHTKKRKLAAIAARAGTLQALAGAQAVFVPHKVNLPIEVASRDPLLAYDVFEDATLEILLAVLFDVGLVYQTMGQEEALARLYNKEWIKKYNRVIYPLTTTAAAAAEPRGALFGSLEALEEYLKKIGAFFVMDKQINRATRYVLRTEQHANDLWELYAVKLRQALLAFAAARYAPPPPPRLPAPDAEAGLEELVLLKDLVGDFMQTMENSGYHVAQLYSVLMVLLEEYYAPQLAAQFRTDFLELIQLDHYMPLVVQDRQDYDNVMKICWYKPGQSFEPKQVRLMPVSFPFSEDYVHYCLGVRLLLEDVVAFIGRHYGYELARVYDAVVNGVFERVLGDDGGISADLRDFISRNAGNKEVVSQSYTNLEFYLYSVYELGKLLSRRLRVYTGISEGGAGAALHLRAVALLTAVRKFAEDAIFEMVDSKIRALLDMVEYDDWMPHHHNAEPNYLIKDFALFLENLFTLIFQNLPLAFRTLGLFRLYDSVAQHFLRVLQEVPRFNRTAIANFDLDIRYLEASMRKLHRDAEAEAEGLVALELTFTELRQCIDLLQLDRYDDFQNATMRQRRFDRVKYDDGVRLIAKMVDDDAASGAATPRVALPTPLAMSLATASKFAKFSNKFRLE